MSDYISSSPAFRSSILAVLVFTDWLLRYGAIIEPEHFPSRDEQEFVKWVNWYYATYRDIPTGDALEDSLDDNPVLDAVYAVEDSSIDHAADSALDFAKQQAMKIAILESVEDVKKGELAKVLARVSDALAVGNDLLELGQELVADRDNWLYTEIHGQRYPTGWQAIDRILGGGTVGGEYGLIMAPTGKGKTTALVNIGCAIAGLLSGTNVAHLTYEMPAHKVLKRYAARLLGYYAPRGSGQRDYSDDLVKAAKAKLRARIRVVQPDDWTVSGADRLIDNMEADGFEVGALIVDYPDNMEPERTRNEFRFELGDITLALRNIGIRRDIPVWGATQTGRHALWKEVITVADIAEAIEKARIADVVLAICQTRDEQELARGRLFGAKIRDAPDNIFVPVDIDLTRSLIRQRGKIRA